MTGKSLGALVTLTAIFVLLFGTGMAFSDDDLKCEADLDEASEVPTPDPVFGTTGEARVEFSEDRLEATYRLEVDDGFRLFMAHIHCAPVGQTGPIIVWLAGAPPDPTGWDVDGNWIRNTTLDDDDVFDNVPGLDNNCVREIGDLSNLADACIAGDCYVNVHSRDNGPGQIRGQLDCED